MVITDTAAGRTGGNVRALRIEPAAVRRLLQRSTAFEGPNALDFAGRRALVATAVDVTRAEVLRTREVLVELRLHAPKGGDPPRGQSVSRGMLAQMIASELEDILDENERRLRSLEDTLSVIDLRTLRVGGER